MFIWRYRYSFLQTQGIDSKQFTYVTANEIAFRLNAEKELVNGLPQPIYHTAIKDEMDTNPNVFVLANLLSYI